MDKEKMKRDASFGLGALLAFGFPAIVWAFFGWKWALVIFVSGQTLIIVAKLIVSNKN